MEQNGNMIDEEWTKPKEGWMKVNCDGVFNAKKEEDRRNEAGIGVVIRDANGRVVIGVARKIRLSSCLEVEAPALREGIFLVESMRIPKIVLEIDSEVLFIELKKDKGKGNWKVLQYIQDILGRNLVLKK